MTLATGLGVGATTVNVAAPVCPSLVAMTEAVPGATAVTRPAAVTVATSGLALDHVTVRPVRTLPAASRSVAVACVPCPAARDVEPRETTIAATGAGAGAAIDTAAVAETASLRAVTVVPPAATAVTRPLEETVAIVGFDDDQVTARLARIAPLASRTVAVNRDVSPFVSVTADGAIAMAAAGTAVTDTDAVASSPSADA